MPMIGFDAEAVAREFALADDEVPVMLLRAGGACQELAQKPRPSGRRCAGLTRDGHRPSSAPPRRPGRQDDAVRSISTCAAVRIIQSLAFFPRARRRPPGSGSPVAPR